MSAPYINLSTAPESLTYLSERGIDISPRWREGPRVLYVMNRDIYSDPRYGASPYFASAAVSLQNSQSGQADYFFFDVESKDKSITIDEKLIHYCRTNRPDFIYWLPIQSAHDFQQYEQCSIPCLAAIRDGLNIPILCHLGDVWSYQANMIALSKSLASASTFLVICDPKSPLLHLNDLKEKIILLWYPFCHAVFPEASSATVRDIPGFSAVSSG
jgi:hypothetical protein